MKLRSSFIVFVLISSFVLSCSKDSSPETQENTINVNANRQATGSSSNDLLSNNTFSRIEIELVYVEGFEPTQASINNFVSFLEARTNKPDGIIVEKREIESPGQTSYTIDDIADIEKEHRTKYNNGNTIAVWALFIDGESGKNTENSVVLGSAYWNTSFVIYQNTIIDFSNSPVEPSRSLLETTVINHEFGHILGLTNLGAALQSEHEDDEHPKHCNNSDCLMYWEAESGAAVSNMISSGSAPELGPECIADLKANGGK